MTSLRCKVQGSPQMLVRDLSACSSPDKIDHFVPSPLGRGLQQAPPAHPLQQRSQRPAEEGNQLQRHPVPPILAVWVGPVVHKILHRLRVPGLGRQHQGSVPVDVGDVQFRPLLHEDLHALHPVLASCHVQRRLPARVGVVELRVCSQQGPHHLGQVLLHSELERRVGDSLLEDQVCAGSLLQQGRDLAPVVLLHSGVELNH
mmetsp:Transcript_25151/g.56780  ORF Transcript_25151/g.56780 Transcript_25151/m.56780 type:complete len:202 (-) Transcript_25151:578-1183(-)